MSRLMNTYARLPLTPVRGEGVWLIDAEGRRYLDAVAGIAVCGLGHAHPEVAEAVAEQARTLVHTANVVNIPLQENLAEQLCDVAGMARAFIANSGVEAVECALKLVRLLGHQRGIERPRVLVATDSFHGRSLAAISAGGSAAAQAGFEPLVDGFVRVPYGDLAAAEQALAENPDIVAVMLEPIQGEAGVRIPPANYLPGLRRLCDRGNRLLVLDEIQTGMCRTGRWFACEHDQVIPDIMTVAKALGNGIPVAACLARGEAAEVFRPGHHGSTFGGNPLACRAALTVIDIMRRDRIAERAARQGERMLAALRDGLSGLPGVRDIRGRGLMIGVELDAPAAWLREPALRQGVLFNVTRETTVRLLPPLIIADDEADRICHTLGALLRAGRQAA